MITVEVNDRVFKQSVEGFTQHLRGTRSVMITIGRGLRDYTKETIKMGGRPTAPWAPLSPWTVERTGRTKPLKGFEAYIRYHATKDYAQLYAVDAFDGWDVDQHHRGYYIPAREVDRSRIMHGHIGGRKEFFLRAKAATVEGRPFWPNYQQTEVVARKAVEDWVAEGARKRWR